MRNRSTPDAVVIPVLCYDDVGAAAAFLCRTFGFTERLRIGTHRIQLLYGQGAIIVTDRGSAAPNGAMGSHSVHVRVDDVDAHCRRAREHGAHIVSEPTDFPFGERQYSAQDPGGHRWTFSQPIADVAAESWGAKVAYQVRRATPADCQGIIAVATAAWKATYQGILPEEVQAKALSQWYSEAALTRQIANPANAFFVATEPEGQAVGFAMISARKELGEAELWRFYVLPEYQGRGLGRRLLSACVEALREQVSVNRVYAQVEKENQIGRRAYEGLGFTLVREYEDDMFGHISMAVELALDLT